MDGQLEEIAVWFTDNLIADEYSFRDPLPSALKEGIARTLVRNQLYGWPDIESALDYLDEMHDWTASQTQLEETK